MKWITRERVKVDRVACPWLIKKFVDPDAAFLFVPAADVKEIAERENATPYDVGGAGLGHHDGRCSFEAIVSKYAIAEPAIAEGFQQMGLKDDHAILALEFPLYDALYAYCQRQTQT